MTTRTITAVWAIALVASARPAVSQVEQQRDNIAFGGASGEFLLLGAGARGAALGGAFAALATDVTALYYNPAGLAQLPRGEAMFSTYDYVAGTRYSWGGLGFPLGGGSRAVGVSIGSFGFGDQPVYTDDDPNGTRGLSYKVRETFFGATYAQNFSDRFAAGFSAKFITDALGETDGSAIAVDFGTSFHARIGERAIRAAFVIQNLGSNLQHDGPALRTGVQREPPLGTPQIPQEPQQAQLRTSPWGLPVLFRVSAALDLYTRGLNRVIILSEFTQPTNSKPGAGAGLEWQASNIGNSGFSLAARGSYTIQPDNDISDFNLAGLTTQQSDGSFTRDGLAVGGGVQWRRGNARLAFDYAWRDLGLLGGTNFLSFGIGW
jgi:hypothetical protein